MTTAEITALLSKYQAGECTPDEVVMLMSIYDQLDEQSLPDGVVDDLEVIWKRNKERFLELYPVERHWKHTADADEKPKNSFRLILAAAMIAAAVLGLIFYIFILPPLQLEKVAKTKVQDIPAGTNKAILTLSSGKQIALDDAASGTLAQQGGVIVRKDEHGRLVYTTATNISPSEGEISYNTITTPNAGQYEVILPDGSKVFLNAASSLKYPIAFTGNERRIELSGEGYFEVAKNPKKPFYVQSQSQEIKVLGTHFNLSSYAGEPTYTTLVEGSVSVATQPSVSGAKANRTVLVPGEQSEVQHTDLEVYKVDPNDVIAWKDGLYIFRNTPLKTVMKQLARWYDVDIAYDQVPSISFEGELPRTASLLEVLRLINATSNTAFTLKGRKVYTEKP